MIMISLKLQSLAVLLLSSCVSCMEVTIGPAPSRLRIEHLAANFGNPDACIDESTPRFSWDVSAPSGWTNVVQSGYRITVLDISHTPPHVLWDTGVTMIHSNKSHLVEYAGPDLPSHAVVNFTVTVEGVGDTTTGASGSFLTTTATGRFLTAFMPSTIGGNATNVFEKSWVTPSNSASNQLRTDFTLPNKNVNNARLYWASPGYAKVFLNGKPTGGDDMLGPWTTWSKRVLYRCYDVTSSINTSSNTIGVWLGNGQYRGPWTHAWAKQTPPLAFVLQMRVSFDDGSVSVLDFDASTWKHTQGPITANDVYQGESYDARLFAHGWSSPGFDAHTWTQPNALDPSTIPLGNLSAHQFTPIRKTKSVRPINVTHTGNGTYLFWFPRNVAGVMQIQNIRGSIGTQLTFAHGAQLKDVNGSVCLVACFGAGRSVYYPFPGAVDTYTLSGDTSGETWSPLFTYHGFQFVEMSGWPTTSAAPTIDTMVQLTVHSDNAVISWPTFSSQLLNDINLNIVQSLGNNMHSVESDCPTRERVGWTGDAQATAETAFRNLEVSSFYVKWMQDMQDAQHDDGALSSTIPYAKHIPPVDPSWPTAYPQIVKLLYIYSGDLRIIQKHYASIKRYVDYIPTVTDCPSCKNGKQTQAPNGLPWFYMNGDWMEYLPQADELTQSGPIMSSYHYILDVEIVASLASLIGETSDEATYSKLAITLTDKFNAVYLQQQNNSDTRSLCNIEKELKKGGKPILLSCGGNGAVINNITFASFGTPEGSCASGFRINTTCDSVNSRQIVTKACLGQATCEVDPTTAVFGGDPCTGTIKSLAIQVQCSTAPPPPPNSTTSWSYGGQTENAVPYMHGMVPINHEQDVLQSLEASIRSAGSLTTGFIGNKYVYPALTKGNLTALAMQLAVQTTVPSLGYQVMQGATTLFENWSGKGDFSNFGGPPSHNHHFMGAMGQWMWDSLVGLKQGQLTAYEHILIQPEITTSPELTWVNATSLTPRGNVSVAWSRSSSSSSQSSTFTFNLHATIPPNMLATIVLPTSAAGNVYYITHNGRRISLATVGESVSNFKTNTLTNGVNRVWKSNYLSLVYVDVGSGTFSFGSN